MKRACAERKTGIPHFDSKFRIEEYIQAIGMPYTILRPVFFFYNYNRMRSVLEMGTFSQPLSPATKLQQFSEEDYGEMVAGVYERRADFLNRDMEVASVEMTMTDVAAVFSRVLGKTVAYQLMSFEAFEERAGKEASRDASLV